MTMVVGYRRQAAPAVEADIVALEQHIGHSLPPDYRAYLSQQGGGRLAGNTRAVKEVFGARSDAPAWGSMWRKLETFSGRVPSWLLPAAQDEYGNLYAVSVREYDLGSVWFWDHELEACDGEPYAVNDLKQVASGWTEFLESLQPIDG